MFNYEKIALILLYPKNLRANQSQSFHHTWRISLSYRRLTAGAQCIAAVQEIIRALFSSSLTLWTFLAAVLLVQSDYRRGQQRRGRQPTFPHDQWLTSWLARNRQLRRFLLHIRCKEKDYYAIFIHSWNEIESLSRSNLLAPLQDWKRFFVWEEIGAGFFQLDLGNQMIRVEDVLTSEAGVMWNVQWNL